MTSLCRAKNRQLKHAASAASAKSRPTYTSRYHTQRRLVLLLSHYGASATHSSNVLVIVSYDFVSSGRRRLLSKISQVSFITCWRYGDAPKPPTRITSYLRQSDFVTAHWSCIHTVARLPVIRATFSCCAKTRRMTSLTQGSTSRFISSLQTVSLALLYIDHKRSKPCQCQLSLLDTTGDSQLVERWG